MPVANDPKALGQWMKSNGVTDPKDARSFLTLLAKRTSKTDKQFDEKELNAIKASLLKAAAAAPSSSPAAAGSARPAG
jgi:hypothetical protein